MKIREIEECDLEQLSKLYLQFWGEKSDVDRMKCQLRIIKQEKMHIILVCEIDNTVVGSVMGIICRELYGDCRPFMVVENMIVDKDYRGRGIGTVLINSLKNEAKINDCSQMILVTEKERTDACAFYEKVGFSKNTTGYKFNLQNR